MNEKRARNKEAATRQDLSRDEGIREKVGL